MLLLFKTPGPPPPPHPLAGVYVSIVAPGSAASTATGAELVRGMQLLTINGTSVEHVTKDQVVQQIKAAGRVWIPARPAAFSFLQYGFAATSRTPPSCDSVAHFGSRS